MHDGMEESDADNKTIGGKSNRASYRELQKEFKKLKFKSQ